MDETREIIKRLGIKNLRAAYILLKFDLFERRGGQLGMNTDALQIGQFLVNGYDAPHYLTDGGKHTVQLLAESCLPLLKQNEGIVIMDDFFWYVGLYLDLEYDLISTEGRGTAQFTFRTDTEQEDLKVMTDSEIRELIIVNHQGISIDVKILLGSDDIKISWGKRNMCRLRPPIASIDGDQLINDVKRELCEAGIKVYISASGLDNGTLHRYRD